MKPWGCAVALGAVVACDSTTPASDRLLHVNGVVLEGNGAPSPPLDLTILAYSPSDVSGSDTAAVRTDAAGAYTADLGPFSNGRLDSVRVQVVQNDCIGPVTTELSRGEIDLDSNESLALPTLSLSYRLTPAYLGIQAAVCAAIVTPFTPQLIGDYRLLALWIDDISDSVRGRWRLNHQASIGDDYGYFSGIQDADQVTLTLRPTQPTPCSGLQLVMPVDANSGAIEPSELTGDGTCSVPNATVRFFDGAQLTELLPPQ